MAKLRRLTALAALLALPLAAPAARADVFSLWSFQPSPHSGSWSSSAAADALSQKKLWSEPVVVNGSEVSLGISLLDTEFESCVFQLRSAFPKASYAGNSSSLLMETKLDGGRRLRLFIVSLPGIYPVVQFTMELPSTLPANPQWPSNLPLPPSSKPLTVMQFPNRGSAYGLFSSALTPDQALSEMRKSMVSGGWHPTGGDGGSNESGGDVYMHEHPFEISIVGAGAGADGVTRGSVYTRALTK